MSPQNVIILTFVTPFFSLDNYAPSPSNVSPHTHTVLVRAEQRFQHLLVAIQ